MLVELKVPEVGESITEVEIAEWLKSQGAGVQRDESVAVLETDKATLELPAPVSGTLAKILKRQGEKVRVGEVIAEIEEGKSVEAKPEEPPATVAGADGAAKGQPGTIGKPERVKSENGRSAKKTSEEEPKKLRPVAKGTNKTEADEKPQHTVARPSEEQRVDLEERTARAPQSTPLPGNDSETNEEEIVPMTALRRRVAERLVEAQHAAALLTTFNEIEMSAVISLRRQYSESFQNKYGIKLGFMSFFVKATIEALKLIPQANAEVRGDDIVYRNYYDIGVAIGGGRGLVVPVLRRAERMSFAEVELAIADFARRAQDNKLTLQELQGGTFTVSNGGIYGSLLSTPIVNPPQSGILGLHAIQDRPVARNGNVVIRPMMYVALTYDHRIIDGREAVTFLKRIKELIEDPGRILLEI